MKRKEKKDFPRLIFHPFAVKISRNKQLCNPFQILKLPRRSIRFYESLPMILHEGALNRCTCAQATLKLLFSTRFSPSTLSLSPRRSAVVAEDFPAKMQTYTVSCCVLSTARTLLSISPLHARNCSASSSACFNERKRRSRDTIFRSSFSNRQGDRSLIDYLQRITQNAK